MSRCDIIIPIWNNLKDTRPCLDSVIKNTSYPFNVIVIDNASSIEVKRYLEKFKEEHKDKHITIITNERNEGFVKAVNRGVKESKEEFICILNNDTIVTRGWLAETISIIEKNYSVGIVNPSSNTLGQNLNEGVTPDSHAEVIKHESGQFVELGSAFGFCMVQRKKLFDEIGLFDEIYGMGYFEDTDFSIRAKEKGYKSVRAIASYVYHRESASFKLLGNFNKNFKRSKKLFESKWGKTVRYAIFIEEITPRSIDILKDLLKKIISNRTWVYVICPYFEKIELYKKYSNLTFYHFYNFPHIYAFFKVFFKKKKINVMYCRINIFSSILKFFNKIEIRELVK